MDSRPSSLFSLSLESIQDPTESTAPGDTAPSHRKEGHHAVQNDHPRTLAAVPKAASRAQDQQDITSDSHLHGERPENTPRLLELRPSSAAAGERTRADDERRFGDRPARDTGRFAGRLAGERRPA